MFSRKIFLLNNTIDHNNEYEIKEITVKDEILSKVPHDNKETTSEKKEKEVCINDINVDEIHKDDNNQLGVKKEDEESIFGELDEKSKDSKFAKFCEIIKNPVYTFSCLGITTLIFISTAVIFWASDYGINVIHGKHNQVLSIFVIVCITGPILGIILGGIVVQKFAGGYEGKHSILFCLIFAICAFVSAVPVRWISNVYGFGVCLWAILFFGGAVIPNIQGVMISSLKKDLRAAGNSMSNILQNLLGFIPAPFVYGILYDSTKESDPKLAMTLVLWYSSVGIVFMSLAMFFRYKNWKILEKLIKTNKLVTFM